ncbi:unnamed protein product, partial [Phaeothamnion confervicola]
MDEVAAEWGLHPQLTARLCADGIRHFFPVQVRAVPDIFSTDRHAHALSRDMCVAAPTGSGKTLVYVLGVLQGLMRRRVPRLRALVLLPSRDLALQVHRVFCSYGVAVGLRVGLAIGQTNFAEEQEDLVGAAALAADPVARARALARFGDSAAGSSAGGSSGDSAGWSDNVTGDGCSGEGSGSGRRGGGGGGGLSGDRGSVDVVVATPGRLLDHLDQTPGFTLAHLRYLVIDEADRLLNQSYYDWVGRIMDSAYGQRRGFVTLGLPGNGGGGGTCGSGSADGGDCDKGSLGGSRFFGLPTLHIESTTVRSRPLANQVTAVRGPMSGATPLRKLLFSATLTQNPEKLASLGLVNPIFYTAREQRRPAVAAAAAAGNGGSGGARNAAAHAAGGVGGDGGDDGGKFSVPAGLSERSVVCEPQTKPLALIWLLREEIDGGGLAIVFTSSVDTTHRLFRLLQLYGVPGRAATAAMAAVGKAANGTTLL